MKQQIDLLTEARNALAMAASTDVAIAALSDDELLASTGLVEEISRRLDVIKARYAAQIARRCRPELGNTGLAAREGHLTAESLLRALTRSSFRDASRRIRVGIVLTESAAAEELGQTSAFSEIATAVAGGDLAIEAADSVIRALTPIAADIDPESLRQATATLVKEGVTCHADDLGTLARGARDTLDRIGVHNREEHLRAQRSLRRAPVVDGLRRVSLILDPESDALFSGAITSAMSPRLGGPRFTDAAEQRRAAHLVDDPRSNEQIALDVLIDLLRIGIDRDDGTILGTNKPALRVTIPLDDLTRAVDEHGHEHPHADTGVAWLEGCSEPLSAATARRILCDAGALPMVLGGASEPLDLGRTRRLFSAAQRVALANRDGGCRWPDCDRPPSWAEAHHINPWNSNGKTDIMDGVLLCRRHHLLLHNHGWRIDRTAAPGNFPLVPPATTDPAQRPRSMPPKLPHWLKTG
jgi:hypothetical protein